MAREKEEEYEKINDLSITGFETITDKGLVNFHSSDVRDGDRIIAESNRRLRVSIERFNRQSSEQSKKIFWLTIAMILVGFAQTLFLIYSIFM
jgi:hypothetical protein